ncbi:DNA polymerase-3 subunit epsilon [Evansella vedderi]|uniref:DNA polymerase-3 subunit epsilon n=1 Tax=Evansella vedderi TaxID=38282 RepID=A0ABT9ZXH5_9BACI|nr:3'-5' exonuclease [Evansella vedderi]MDQ0255650.1 DNA polymerase-3 subunit epsilon [Evansella vedderi]
MRQYKSWNEVPDNLVSKTKLKTMKLVPNEIRATVYQRKNNVYINLYDVSEAKKRKEPTERQLKAIEKAREALIAKKTCPKCKGLLPYILDGGLCEICIEQEWMKKQSERASKMCKDWMVNKEKYLILDTETTGLGNDDEIIELGIINLNGQTIFHSTFKPSKPIEGAASEVHGLTDEMLQDCPLWPIKWQEIQKVISNKTLLIFNSNFDIRMIERTNCKYNIESILPVSICVMETYAKYAESYYYNGKLQWISLQRAIDYEGINIVQQHTAVDDCILTLKLINVMANNISA